MYALNSTITFYRNKKNKNIKLFDLSFVKRIIFSDLQSAKKELICNDEKRIVWLVLTFWGFLLL
jgi:hypothetical protein